MVFGFVYVNAQKHGLIDDSTRQNLLSRPRTLLPVVVAALLGFFGYTAFTLTCLNKPECNAVHSYTAFVPVTTFYSFILKENFRVRFFHSFHFRLLATWFCGTCSARSASGTRRSSRGSAAFPSSCSSVTIAASFGTALFRRADPVFCFALTTRTGQYHIWLAADTHGVLVLVPGYPALNLLVTTFVLVCAAHEVHAVTGRLAAVAVPADWKRTLRNLLLFFLALVPVAVHTGAL